jgi:hypothetical protein
MAKISFLALLAALAGILALLLLDGGISKKRVTIAMVISIAVSTVIYFVDSKAAVPEVEVSGSLLPDDESTPANSCDRDLLPANALRILIGDNTAAMIGDGKITAIQIGNCPVLSMQRKSDKISVAVNLYDVNGRLIASTNDGAIHAITGENVQVRRDGDLSTIIIENGSGKELLYVKYLNPTTVMARGIFGCPGFKPVTVKEGQPIAAPFISGGCSVNAGTFVVIK